MAKLSDLIVDVKAQEEGEWRAHPYFDGVEVLVRSIHCEAYRKRRATLYNRLPPKRRKHGDAMELTLRLDREALDACLGGWRGIDEAEYSPDRAREWSIDPRFRRFWEGVRELAEDIGESEASSREESVRD